MNYPLISIVNDYIWNNESNIQLDEELTQIVTNHRVEGIVYKQTNNERLKEAYISTFLTYKLRMAYIKEIENILLTSDIDFFWVKGHLVSQYYRDPFLKTMSDSDLVVHLTEKEKVKEVLSKKGYFFGKDDIAEWHFVKNGIRFELHHALLYEDEVNKGLNDDYPRFFNDCWKYVENHTLDPSFHFLFMIIHLRKHIFYQGVGVRLFLDLALYLKADLNEEWIEKQLHLLNLDSFAIIVFGLIYSWWGIRSPFMGIIPDTVVDSITKKVIKNGVFGIQNVSEHQATDRIIKNSKSQYLLSRFFLPYSFFVEDAGFKFIIGRPYLLPVGWCAHFVRVVMRSIKQDNYLKLRLPSKKSIRLREEELKAWGLCRDKE